MTPQPTRLETNRANAQHSTGPKTEAGKKTSSLNAVRHGLTSQIVVLPTEDLAVYERHAMSFTDEYRPQGPTEAHLVQVLADTSWRLNRVTALETNMLSLAAGNQPDPLQGAVALAAALESQTKALSNLSMYTQRLSRQFEKTVTLLREVQKTRLAQEEEQLKDLLDIIQMYEARGVAYDPAEDGFVFSDSQIASAIHARNRENLASAAYVYRYQFSAD